MFIRKYISTIKIGYFYRLCLARLRNFEKKLFNGSYFIFGFGLSEGQI